MINNKRNFISYTTIGDRVKIEYLNENCFMIYLNKFYLKEAQFGNKIDLELYFKSFFLTLKKYYGINMEGFYTIDVYKDKFYGMILKVKKEDFDYFDEDTIDMKLRVKETSLLYEIQEEVFPKKLMTCGNFFKDKTKLYYKLEKEVSAYDLGLLEEYTKIKIDTSYILEHAKKISKEIITIML